MLKALVIILAVISGIHGLIHLMGFVAYWPLAQISELPYKTSFLGGRVKIGTAGARLFSVMWLLAALGFVISAVLMIFSRPAWANLMLVTVLLSLAIGILDWGTAFRGALIDVGLLLVLLVVFGLRVQPAPFPAYRAVASPVTTRPIPEGLPEPVRRFYDVRHGDQVPLYTSAVVSGRGTVRSMGITFPARLRFSHIAGQDYRHYIEATFYGLPVFKVNEHYIGGHSRLSLPFGVVENDPKVDSAANHGLWAETLGFFPSVLVTDPRVRWAVVDNTTARAHVPFREDEQVLTVQFDHQTGEMLRVETTRYRDEKVGVVRWWGDIRWREPEDGEKIKLAITITWEDEGTPWLIAEVEDIVFNTDLSAYIRQTGP